MAAQASLDALIRQQNESVLGGEDVGRVLEAYEARKRSGQRQPTRPRQAPQPVTAASRVPISGATQQHQLPAMHGPGEQVQHLGQQHAPPTSFMMQQHASQAPPRHAPPPPPESVDAASRAGGRQHAPRVRKEPANLGSAYVSTQMEDALQPVRNEREALKRAGLQPHNHHRDNVHKIREKQHEVQTRKAAEEMEAHRQQEARRRARQQAMSTAARVDRPTGVPAKPPPATVERHGSYGRVPKYLAERKAARQEEEELAREEAERLASCPPGTRLVTEEERATVLATIATREAELRKELNSMPFVTKTVSHANRKKLLEDRLEEIEQARAQYSKPRVYVALDS